MKLFDHGISILTCIVSSSLKYVFLLVVTIYATLGEEAIIHALNETEVKMVITTHDLLPKFRAILDKTPLVETVIFMEDQLKPTDTSGFKSGVEILPFKQVLDVGSKSDYGKCDLPNF